MNFKLKVPSFKNIKGEIWKEIKDFPDYIVSNFGRVRRQYLNRKSHISDSDGCLSPSYSTGYGVVILRKDNKNHYKKVHRLVAEAFIPNPNNLPDINHKDENKRNNKVDNLEWCSKSYNNIYNNRAIKAGEKKRRYINIYRVKNGDKELIANKIKLSDCKLYGISYQAVYKYLDKDKNLYSRVKHCMYKIESYDNIEGV